MFLTEAAFRAETAQVLSALAHAILTGSWGTEEDRDLAKPIRLARGRAALCLGRRFQAPARDLTVANKHLRLLGREGARQGAPRGRDA